jgi:hypothetical protein
MKAPFDHPKAVEGHYLEWGACWNEYFQGEAHRANWPDLELLVLAALKTDSSWRGRLRDSTESDG